MSMCDCNQGRLPCTCKPIEGERVMNEVKRFRADWRHVVETEFDDAQYVGVADFDRVTAERDALQELLNAADQKDGDLSFQLKDREGSRRDWLEEAQRLEKENEELRSEVKRLDLMVSQADHDYEMKRNDLERQLAKRDALLEDWHAANAAGEVKVSDKAYRIVTRTAAVLSASAEPASNTVWVDWHGGECPVPDDAEVEYSMSGNPGKVFSDVAARLDWKHDHRPTRKKPNICRYRIKQASASAEPSAPKCETCPECAVPSAPVERDERAEFEAWYLGKFCGGQARLFRCVNADQIYYFAEVQSRWDAWQARAALERKP